MKLIFILMCAGLAACAQRPSNEIDQLSEEVIKKNRGVDIQIKPIGAVR